MGAQRRPPNPSMANQALLVAVVAIVVLAALVTVPFPDLTHLLPTPVPSPDVLTQASPAPAPRASASEPPSPRSATSAPVITLPRLHPEVTPFPALELTTVDAGPAPLHPAGSETIELEVTLPEGWARASDSMYVRLTDDPESGLSISAWQLANVFAFPCRWASREFADPPLMRTLEGQAEALSAWWGQDPTRQPSGNSELAPLATEPQATSFHGYRAWRVEVLIPRGLDLAQCDASQLVLWESADGQVRISVPGELHWLYVLDVEERFIVLDAASLQATSVVDRAQLQSVLDSIVIQP